MKKYIVILIIIILATGAYFGFRSTTTDQGFNLGLISILSGDYAAVGENVRNGVVLASEIYNREHPDSKIKLIIEDDGFSGGKGVSAYQKLINIDKIDALINLSTPTIDAIYDTAVKTDLPIIQIGEQGRDPKDDNVLGIFPSSIVSEYDFGVYFKEKGTKDVSIVYTNMDAMVRFKDAFKKGFDGKVTEYVVGVDEKDFRTHAAKLAADMPNNIVFLIYPQQGAQFIKEFMKVKKNKPQIAFDANFQSGLPDYQRILTDLKVLDGAIVATLDSNLTLKFKNQYKERYGSEPGFLADMGFDGFNLLASTYDKDQKQWIENIKKSNVEGANGRIKFDENGNRLPKMKVVVIKDGVLTDPAK